MLSIVTVTKNNIVGLEKTYLSILNQNEKPSEWIIIDGFSNDGTKGLIEKISNNITIKYFERNPKGVYDAIEFGLSKATMKWVQFLNAGDVFTENTSIQHISNELIIASNEILLFSYFKNNNIVKSTEPKIAKLGTCHQAIIYPTEIVKKYPFDFRVTIFADNFQMTQMILDGTKYKVFETAIINFESGGISEISFKKGLFEMRYVWIYKYGNCIGYLMWFFWIMKIIITKMKKHI
jgi:glycosyltransferase involved in cell wall biosynthesis